MKLLFVVLSELLQIIFLLWVGCYLVARIFMFANKQVMGVKTKKEIQEEYPDLLGPGDWLTLQICIFVMSPAIAWEEIRERWLDWRDYLRHKFHLT
jgi:hypothetical protein